MTTRREMMKGGIAATAICAGEGISMSYGNVHSLLGARGMAISGGEKSLPYDAEVEWLGANYDAWLDTTIFGRNGLKISFRFALTSLDVGARANYIILSRQARVYTGACVFIGAGVFSFGANGGASTSEFPIDEQWHSVVINTTLGNKIVIFDDTEFRPSASTNLVTTTTPFRLWDTPFSGSTEHDGMGASKISYCNIEDTETGSLLQSFQPVRFTNELMQSEGAMYDKVSGQLFRNQGTGAFVIGPDV